MRWHSLLRMLWAVALTVFLIPLDGFCMIHSDATVTETDAATISEQAFDGDFTTLAELTIEDRAAVVAYLRSSMSPEELSDLRNEYFDYVRREMVDLLSRYNDGATYAVPEVIRNLEMEISDSYRIDEKMLALTEDAQVAIEYAQKTAWVEAENSYQQTSDGCWYGKKTLYWYDLWTWVWTFESSVNWCGNGTYITWQDGGNAYGWANHIGGYVYYPQDLQRKNSGSGDYTEWCETHGHFALCWSWCWRHWWPYIHHNFWGNGSYNSYYGFR